MEEQIPCLTWLHAVREVTSDLKYYLLFLLLPWEES